MNSLAHRKRIGAYDLGDVIGRGIAGTVFQATDPHAAGRPVAIKVLTLVTDDPDLLLLKFYREAKDTGSLQHPNIVTVHELGYEDGLPYVVMEYLQGVSLAALMAGRRPLPIAEKLRIAQQVCAGLGYAHKQDFVHRDIRPANIVVLEDNTAKIIDFGIAAVGGKRVSQTGQSAASLAYMSPEQVNGNVELDRRTDIYSTGVLLFELLTGVVPFEGGTPAVTITKILRDPTPSLGRYMKDCPAELEAIVGKALARDRDERYSSADDLAGDLAGVQQQYQMQMLRDDLQQATALMERKDFVNARQQVLQVLQRAPQMEEAGSLLRLIKDRQDDEEREQQVLQMQKNAEEACRRGSFDSALQFVERGLQLRPDTPALLRLRSAITNAREKTARHREAVQRAELALQAGDLENALVAADRATEIFPEDPQSKRLAGEIRSRMEQRAREQEAARKEKKLALDIATVEDAIEEARNQLALARFPTALQVLDGIKGKLLQVPAKWGEQVELLKRDIWASQDRAARHEKEQQRAQQISQLQQAAEDAFRRNAFDNALQLVEQGLRLDPAAAGLVRLREAIVDAKQRTVLYREALQGAEQALQAGDLEGARASLDRAVEMFPDDPQCRRVAGQIKSRMEQAAREQEAARREKDMALDIHFVEKAMNEARVQLSLGQFVDALQLLEGADPYVAQLPPKWGEEMELLKREARTQQERAAERSAAIRIGNDPMETWKTATSFGPSPKVRPEVVVPFPRAPEKRINTSPVPAEKVDFRPGPLRMPEQRPVPPRSPQGVRAPVTRPEPAEPSTPLWMRSTFWLGVAVVALAIALVLLLLRPRTGASSQPPVAQPSAAIITYAEINAEPWGIVKELIPARGDAQKAIGLTTPLRVNLPAGEYNITLEGPNHERTHAAFMVPAQGGGKCFVTFKKPDINQLVNHQ